MRKNRAERPLIGDNGVVKKTDMFGGVVIGICACVIAFLIFLAIMVITFS